MNEKIETNNSVSIKGQALQITESKGYKKIVVADTTGKYPLLMAFDFKSENLRSRVSKGDTVEVKGYASTREWQGKYFTGIRGVFIRVVGALKEVPVHQAKIESVESTEDFDEVPY